MVTVKGLAMRTILALFHDSGVDYRPMNPTLTTCRSEQSLNNKTLCNKDYVHVLI
jgi:hypothetical protein